MCLGDRGAYDRRRPQLAEFSNDCADRGDFEPRQFSLHLIIGLFLGPLGIIVGPLAGAIVGELIFKDDMKYALKAGFGSLFGFLTGIGLKLAASFIMTFYFVKELIVR